MDILYDLSVCVACARNAQKLIFLFWPEKNKVITKVDMLRGHPINVTCQRNNNKKTFVNVVKKTGNYKDGYGVRSFYTHSLFKK